MSNPSLLSVLLLLAAAACASPSNADRAEAAANTMREMKTALADAPTKITAVSTALDELAKEGGDMKAEFKTYSDNVSALVKHRDKLRSLRQQIEESRTQFAAAWEKKTKEIKNEDMRNLAEKRRAALAEKFTELNAIGDAGRNEFEPWLETVLDVRTYLESDLNPTGVASMSTKVKQIRSGSASVNKKINTVVTSLEEISSAIAAAKPPEPPAAEATAPKK